MNYEVLEAFGQIVRERNVDKKLIMETLEAGLLSAAKRRFGTADHIRLTMNEEQGEIGLFATRSVVEGEALSHEEISLEEAQVLDPEAQVGGEVVEELHFADFGRNAIQTAKQILIQRIREAEREKIYKEYLEKIGELATGSVQQISRGDVIVNLGRTEAVMPVKEQIRRERYRQGDTIRAYIVEVQKTSKGPQVILSRTHPRFLEKLLEIEVPEIYEGIVAVEAVARVPGERSKIAVSSTDNRVDPVGACVGMKGTRVQSIVRELSNERIDIIPWDPEPEIFLRRALSPAEVRRVERVPDEQRLIALVDADQLSLAIGRAGQNARLAANLLEEWKIDILSEEQYQDRLARAERMKQQLREDLSGVGEKLAEDLSRYRILTVEKLARTSVEELTEVPGLGPKKAQNLLDQAIALVAEKASLRAHKPIADASSEEEESEPADG
ncbi:MAG: transcription termination factor NusA [Candidatus Latescibacteria bacterium]|nr:transcription termination factor NusA [Candidatus Latescibacterota bacterium]MCK5328847.1 transcription termination factor NusA [Candidatus Latescibacterota bacterium]MCK5526675.1 transcription termination factor NusA [Candidatus Latescibacterota bacterium]MCK5732940.1 transcription termination factor NusA [Candidatus Latescibacterota bacterium]